MATLKEIAVRLKSVKNIQKITGSMKMVAASKFSRAEKELRAAKVLGYGASSKYRYFYTFLVFYQCVSEESKNPEILPNSLLIAITSDRGLCGSAHVNIVKVFFT